MVLCFLMSFLDFLFFWGLMFLGFRASIGLEVFRV